MNKGFEYNGMVFYPVGNLTSKQEKDDIWVCIGKAQTRIKDNYNYDNFYGIAEEKGKDYVKDLYTTDNGGLFIPTRAALHDISEAVKVFGYYNYKSYTIKL